MSYGECCGNYLPSGECCAAIYGTDRLVMVEDEQEQQPALLDKADALAALVADADHALAAVNEALDKNAYGDQVESALLEAHATLESALAAARRLVEGS